MKRTLGLWVVLIVLFFAFYQFFSPPPGAPRPPSTDGATFVPQIAAVFFGFFFLFLWFNTRWLKPHNEGVVLMQQGRVVEALERFRAVRARTRSALPVLNEGVAALQLWMLPEAISALEEFKKRGGRSPLRGGAPGALPLANGSLALAHALRNESEQAKKLIAESAGSAISRLAEVVVAARAEQWSVAQTLLREHSLLLDQLGGPQRALADAVHALVSSKLGGPGGSVDRVRLFRERGSDTLRQAWPQLVEFVDRVSAGPQLTVSG